MHPNLITFVWKLLFTSLMTEILPYLLLQKVFFEKLQQTVCNSLKILEKEFLHILWMISTHLKQLWKPFSYKMIKKLITQVKICSFCLKYQHSVYQDATKVLSNCLRLVEQTNWLASCRTLDCSQSPISPRDRRDIARLTINCGHLDFQM